MNTNTAYISLKVGTLEEMTKWETVCGEVDNFGFAETDSCPPEPRHTAMHATSCRMNRSEFVEEYGKIDREPTTYAVTEDKFPMCFYSEEEHTGETNNGIKAICMSTPHSPDPCVILQPSSRHDHSG